MKRLSLFAATKTHITVINKRRDLFYKHRACLATLRQNVYNVSLNYDFIVEEELNHVQVLVLTHTKELNV